MPFACCALPDDVCRAGDLWQNWASPQWWRLSKGKCATGINANNYFFLTSLQPFPMSSPGWFCRSGLCAPSVTADFRAGARRILSVNVSSEMPSLSPVLPAELPIPWGLCWEVPLVWPSLLNAVTHPEENPAEKAVPNSPLGWRKPCKSGGKWGWCSAHRACRPSPNVGIVVPTPDRIVLLGMAPCPLQGLQVMRASPDLLWAWCSITLDHSSVASALS